MSKDTKAVNITALTRLKEYQVAITTGISIIKFSSVRCAPCKRISETYQVLADNNTNVRFYHLDIEQVPQITIKEQISEISAILAFIVYYNGERLCS